MEQTLLNEIVARVAAKLAEAEGGEAASAAASRDDREGLLLLCLLYTSPSPRDCS